MSVDVISTLLHCDPIYICKKVGRGPADLLINMTEVKEEEAMEVI